VSSSKTNVSRKGTVFGSPSSDRFAPGFDRMAYWIRSAPDQFDLAKFRSLLPPTAATKDASAVSVAQRNERIGDYHVLFSWTIKDEQLKFTVEYRRGTKKHESDEREPYAEDFMKWFGQFFAKPSIDAHFHIRFRHAVATRKSKYPLSIGALPLNGQLDGIAVQFPSNHIGVTELKLDCDKVYWHAELIADGSIKFYEFTPFTDTHTLSGVLDMFLTEEVG
jgi:hypothetical protein